MIAAAILSNSISEKHSVLSMAETKRDALYAIIYETVSEIPTGKVATYGQIARLIGLPRHARHVGFALGHLVSDTTVPWHRVVNAQGKMHKRKHGDQSEQKIRLQNEGITFKENGNIDLTRHQWQT